MILIFKIIFKYYVQNNFTKIHTVFHEFREEENQKSQVFSSIVYGNSTLIVHRITSLNVSRRQRYNTT